MNLVKKYELTMSQNILSNRLVLSSEFTSSSSSILSSQITSSIKLAKSIKSITKKSMLKNFFKFTIFTTLIKKFFTISSTMIFLKQNFVVVIFSKISMISFISAFVSLIISIFFEFFDALIRRFARLN